MLYYILQHYTLQYNATIVILQKQTRRVYIYNIILQRQTNAQYTTTPLYIYNYTQ